MIQANHQDAGCRTSYIQQGFRIDNKLISSNIARHSRHKIIPAAFVKCVSGEALERIDDQIVRQQAQDFLQKDAAKTVYRTGSERHGQAISFSGHRDKLPFDS